MLICLCQKGMLLSCFYVYDYASSEQKIGISTHIRKKESWEMLKQLIIYKKNQVHSQISSF